MAKLNKVYNSYKHGECPDCGESIPKDVQEGQSCRNCDHVFYELDYAIEKRIAKKILAGKTKGTITDTDGSRYHWILTVDTKL